ncbi:hypothetical protein SDC9_131720 [bioreactor metagenome]|uniref:Uncharacterized protein n=1 Tax=bioreactor metagenome TaxID=1076179 RepID=A0A645D624_9ZZZZ
MTPIGLSVVIAVPSLLSLSSSCSGTSVSFPSPSAAFISNPVFAPSSFSCPITPQISTNSISERSTGISFVSSATPRLREYSLTAFKISVAVICSILSLFMIIIGEIRSSSERRSESLLFPASSTLTLYICAFCSCIWNIRLGSKSTRSVCGFILYLMLSPFSSL